jgi:hypothetical protein
VNVEDNTTAGQNLTIGAAIPPSTTPTGPTGLNDSLTVLVGNKGHADFAGKGGDALGDLKAFGYEQFTLTSNGGGQVGPGNANDLGGTILVPTLGGNEQVTIGGDTTLLMAVTHSAFGAIQDQTNTGILNANNLTITITNTAATEWGEGTPGTNLFFVNDAGANGGKFAPAVAYSNNAVKIDATTSGGLVNPWGDANFVGNQGDTILGATNPVGFKIGGATVGNVFAGSPGNDTLTSNSLTLPDYIVTNGGKDTINLAAGHTGADHIGFYNANGDATGGGNYAVASVAGSISEGGVGAFEFANPAWWGIAAGGSSTAIDDGVAGSLFPGVVVGTGAGTSADQSTVNNFNVTTATSDVLDFSVQAWSTAGLIGFGLTQDTGGGLANAAPAATPTGAAVTAVQVAPGGSIAGTGADFIVLSQGSFLDANAVAQALAGGSYTVNHSALGATVEADFLLAYQGIDGNAHIANLHLAGTGGTSTAVDLVTASDMVNLAGVSLTQLVNPAAGGIGAHIHLIT